jgi:phage tail-like protein
MPTTADRGYTTARYLLELDGTVAGSLNSTSGGYATSDVVEEKVGSDLVLHKHLAGVKYEDITIECGAGMSKAFYNWLAGVFEQKHLRKDGALVTTDYNFKEASRLNFFQSLVTEIGFPALDAASKDAAKFTLKFAPEYTRSAKGSGTSSFRVDGQKQKHWLPANFRLTIDGVDCTRVNKIEPLVVKQKVVDQAVGELRQAEKVPALLEIPDLVVTVAESHADDFVAWHHDFVVQGNNGPSYEKNGTLEFLASDMNTVLFMIGFSGLGIYKLVPEPVRAGSENIRRLIASMYCEQMTFKASTSFDGAQSAAAAPPASSAATNGGQADATSTPVFVGDQEPPLVVVSGANGPFVTQDIPDRFTRIRRTT